MPRKVNQETRERISKTMKERYQDPEYCEMVEKAREEKGVGEKIRASRTPELRKKIGTGAKKSWEDPIQLRKRITTLLRKLETVEGRVENSLEIAEA
jgi:hypothetical protein